MRLELVDIRNRVYHMTFTFQTRDGTVHQTKVRSQELERLQDEPLEPLLYHPRRPRSSVLLDDLPGSPQITPSGALDTGRPGRTKLYLIGPLVSVVTVPGFVFWWFLIS